MCAKSPLDTLGFYAQNAHMTQGEIVERLRKSNGAKVSRETGLPYSYLRHLLGGHIKNPGHRQIDLLRSYFLTQELRKRA